MANIDNVRRVRAASTALSLTSYMGFSELHLPSDADEVSLLFATPKELEGFRRWAISEGGMDNFASVKEDVCVCLDADWREPVLSEKAVPEDVESFAVRFEFLRLPAAQWRIEAMCVLAGEAPLHEAWLENFGSGVVVHVSYKLPTRADYDQHLRQGLHGSQWPDEPVLRASYANSYGRFAYYQHDNFHDNVDRQEWFLKPRVNERDA